MYFLKYGEEFIHDPRFEEDRIIDWTSTFTVNASADISFTIPKNHTLYNIINERDVSNEIVLYDDDQELFRGIVTDYEEDFEKNRKYNCIDHLSYLHDYLIRPYISGHNSIPHDTDAYFEWIIGQYNKNADAMKKIQVGINQAKLIDPDNKVYFEESNCVTPADAIKKLLDNRGGYIRLRFDKGTRIIDWLADFDRSDQRIEFGINLFDYARHRNSSDIFTAIMAFGDDGLDLTAIPDGSLQDGFFKRDDVVFSSELGARYSTRVINRTYETANVNTLINLAIKDIKEQRLIDGLDLKAVDLSLIDKRIDKLKLYTYIRTTSQPHDLDLWLACVQINLDILRPEQTRYILGRIEATLTNKTTLRVAALQAEVEDMYVSQEAISKEAQNAAEEAKKAGETAEDKSKIWPPWEWPKPPYKDGDMWVSPDGEIKIVLTPKPDPEDEFDEDDWVDETKYTDDETANNALYEASQAQNQAAQAAEAALNAAKAASDASLEAQAAKSAADEADLKAANAIQSASDANLEALTAKAMANSKAKIFTEEPTPPYNINDVWMQGTNGVIFVCITFKNEEESFSSEDWVVADGYALQKALDALATDTFTSIMNTQDSILLFVGSQYATQSEVGNIQASLSSQLALTNESMTLKFLEQASLTRQIEDTVLTETERRLAVLRFSGEGIDIGREDSILASHMDNRSLEFLMNGTSTTVLNNIELITNQATLKTGVYIGSGDFMGMYTLAQLANGNLSLRYKGGDN